MLAEIERGYTVCPAQSGTDFPRGDRRAAPSRTNVTSKGLSFSAPLVTMSLPTHSGGPRGTRALMLLTIGTLLAAGCGNLGIEPSALNLGGGPLSGYNLLSGLTLETEGVVNGEISLKAGEVRRVNVRVGDPAGAGLLAGQRFLYLAWSWNNGKWPDDQPTAGPLTLVVEDDPGLRLDDPVWSAMSRVWTQRGWLDGPRTVTFVLTATSEGRTSFRVGGHVAPPERNVDGSVSDVNPYASQSLYIRVVP
jgi:hypothetical protein